MDKGEIPSKFSSFYRNNLITDANKKNKIKFNDEVFHQSKVLNYFLNKNSLTKTQKMTDNLLSKMKNDKNKKKSDARISGEIAVYVLLALAAFVFVFVFLGS